MLFKRILKLTNAQQIEKFYPWYHREYFIIFVYIKTWFKIAARWQLHTNQKTAVIDNQVFLQIVLESRYCLRKFLQHFPVKSRERYDLLKEWDGAIRFDEAIFFFEFSLKVLFSNESSRGKFLENQAKTVKKILLIENPLSMKYLPLDHRRHTIVFFLN